MLAIETDEQTVVHRNGETERGEPAPPHDPGPGDIPAAEADGIVHQPQHRPEIERHQLPAGAEDPDIGRIYWY